MIAKDSTNLNMFKLGGHVGVSVCYQSLPPRIRVINTMTHGPLCDNMGTITHFTSLNINIKYKYIL